MVIGVGWRLHHFFDDDARLATTEIGSCIESRTLPHVGAQAGNSRLRRLFGELRS
jgi:hypothetical protein